MANLGPLYQNQTYGNLLQVDGGLTAELKPVLDGDGNASALSLSLTSVGVEGLVASAASNLYGGVPGVVPYQVAPDTTGFTAVGPVGYVLASAGAAQPVWTNTIQNSTYSNSTFDVFGGAAGQILYQVGPNDTSFTGAGESGQVLTSSGGGAPYWSSSIAFAGLANNAYNISGGTPGQLLYQSNVGETSKVATGTSGQLLVSNGIAAPSWNTITAADVGAVALDGSSVMTGDLWMNYNQVKGVGTPTSNNDAANKAYVDSVATGLKIKAACVAASTANVTLSGSATVDGVALNNLDRVLIKNQTDATTNGIYSVNTSGAWSRTTDADTWSELVGATVFITGGSVNINTTWACNISAGGNFGENITFVQFGASTTYTAGTGLTLAGSQFSLTTPVSVANGGSGVATLTGILKGNGTSAFSAATASDVVSLIGTTPVQNATSASTCSGNAATATILQTARAINGVSFNGSAAITITANTNYWCYFTAGGAGDASGSYFNGSAARNISYNTIGAAAADGSNASGTWPISINASNLVGTVAANKGGTGISSYAVGDMLVAASSTALGRLAVGTEGYVLAVYSGIPTWRSASSVLSLGTMATQNASAVDITGGSINGTSIGSTSAANGKFAGLISTDNVNLSGFITVTSGEAAYFRNPRIYNPTQTYWYRITPSAISTNVYTTLPALAGNDTFVFEGHTQTLTNKTINVDNNTISGIAASSFVLSNSGGNIDGLAAQKVIPSGVVVGTTDTQTLTNKTLTSPTISGGSISGITDLAIADGGTGASTAADAIWNITNGLTGRAAGKTLAVNSSNTGLEWIGTTAVTAGTYTAATLTIDSAGRITAASSTSDGWNGSYGGTGYLPYSDSWWDDWIAGSMGPTGRYETTEYSNGTFIQNGTFIAPGNPSASNSGLFSAVHTKDTFAQDNGSIAIQAYVINDRTATTVVGGNTYAPTTAWGLFIDARRYGTYAGGTTYTAPYAGFTTCMELNITNYGNVISMYPYSTSNVGATFNIWATAGQGNGPGTGNSNIASTAGLALWSNGPGYEAGSQPKYDKGILIQADCISEKSYWSSIASAAYTVQEAMSLGNNQGITWYNSVVFGSPTAFIKASTSAPNPPSQPYGRPYIEFGALNSDGVNLALSMNKYVNNCFTPNFDISINLGSASNRYYTVYALTPTINTSDAREKEVAESGIDAAIFAAWAKVKYEKFKWKASIEEKGDGARWHIGVIAQQVKEAFESEGLDAFEYGLLCYDEWEEQEIDGVIEPAGNRYGIRYEEALALECAYLRNKLESLTNG